MEDYRCYQSTVNYNQELPLHVACKNEILKLLSSLLKADDINTKDLDGNTPLHIVCGSLSSYEKIFDCCKYLMLEKRTDINIQNNLGELPLHILLKSQPVSYNWEKLTVMISNYKSFKVNAQDSSGNTPMHIACMKGNVKAVLYLASNFTCNLNLTNEEGCLPLHYALGTRMSLEAIKAVTSRCTLKHMQNNVGKTPLHIACEEYYSRGDRMMLLELISDTGSTNVQDTSGNTPLHFAYKSCITLRLFST